LPLQVIRFSIKDTIEERIQKILDDKRDLFQGYIEDADIAEIGKFTKEDLLRILSTQ
jgi:SNF2 family DNA or RNA helicase